MAICKVHLKMFNKEIRHKMFKFTFLKIHGQQARRINVAIFFALPSIKMNVMTLLKTFQLEAVHHLRLML